MHHLLWHWLLNTVSLLIVTKILPGIRVDGFGAALLASLAIGLVTATVGLLLKIVLLPFIILTLGLLYFFINGLMLKLASDFVPGFHVEGCLTAVIGSALLSVITSILDRVVGL